MTAGSVFMRRRMYGRTSSRSGANDGCGAAASRLVQRANAGCAPSRPGLMTSKIDQRSVSRFSTGVPVSAIRVRRGERFDRTRLARRRILDRLRLVEHDRRQASFAIHGSRATEE